MQMVPPAQQLLWPLSGRCRPCAIPVDMPGSFGVCWLSSQIKQVHNFSKRKQSSFRVVQGKTAEPWLLHEFEEDFYDEELRLMVNFFWSCSCVVAAAPCLTRFLRMPLTFTPR